MSSHHGTKLTLKLIDSICSYIRSGCDVMVAAQAIGVSKRTLGDWLCRGNDEIARRDQLLEADRKEEIFVKLVTRFEKAVAESEIRDMTRIDIAADTQWQAAAWKLERLRPGRYGRKVIAEINAPVEREERNVDVASLPLEIREKILEYLLNKEGNSNHMEKIKQIAHNQDLLAKKKDK
jgi:hypothetical protein